MKQIDIKGFENYQITDDGRVWSKKNKMYLSTNRKDSNGYPQVVLYSKGNPKGTPINIHQLVAQAFIPNLDNKPCIDHINGDKTDNRVENLHWVTYKENMANPITYSKVKGANIGRKWSEERKIEWSKSHSGENSYWYGKHLTEEAKKKLSESHKGKMVYDNRRPVDKINKITGEVLASFACIKDAVNQGYTHSQIVLCCQGKIKQHKNYVWKYISTSQ